MEALVPPSLVETEVFGVTKSPAWAKRRVIKPAKGARMKVFSN